MLIRCHKDPKTCKSTYAAYFASCPGAAWCHLATFRVAGGKPFDHGFYSFVEDFKRDTRSASYEREAEFGPACFQVQDETRGGASWFGACQTKFTASSAEFERKDNIDCVSGLHSGTRVLCTGGGRFCGSHKLDDGFQKLECVDFSALCFNDCPSINFES